MGILTQYWTTTTPMTTTTMPTTTTERHESNPRDKKSRKGHVRTTIHTAKQKTKTMKRNLNSQFDQTMVQMMVAAMDVAKSDNPPMTFDMATAMGLKN